TDDGGQTWERPLTWHADYHALAFHPDDDQTILIGNDGGLEKSIDGGVTSFRVEGLPITQFYEIAVNPADPDHVLGGTQDNGSMQSLDPAVGNWQRLTGGDGFYVIVDPEPPGFVYTTSQNGQLYRNGASIVQSQTYKSNWSTPIAMSPANSSVLYYGAERLLRSADRGNTWTSISSNLTSHSVGDRLGTITTISISPLDPRIIYVGTDDGNIWITRDEGSTWTRIADGLPERWVTRVETHPQDPAIAVVTFSGLKWRDAQPHVFRTDNFGGSWQNISGNLPDAPVNALALDPIDTELIYIGTDIGAFYTTDSGSEWQILGTGLPAVPVYDLKFIAAERRIVAGTHGRSMYSIMAPGTPTSSEQPAAAQLAGSVAYPNPSASVVTIEFGYSGSLETTVGIYDTLGRLVRQIENVDRLADRIRVVWDGTDRANVRVASGLYFARLVNPGADANLPAIAIVRTN
ncbi:MAG: T9SS type A sorting domain-containing protein, partial [Rhodothermales bacterium]|nr:T9SS type A sorting domain-containing protein [Rhodothermales bacterium]